MNSVKSLTNHAEHFVVELIRNRKTTSEQCDFNDNDKCNDCMS